MDAIELLTHQHREIESFFRELRLLDRNEPQARREILSLLREAIEAHGQLEERLFYPAAQARRTARALGLARSEHLEIRRRLLAMADVDVSEPRFDSTLLALEEAIRAHNRSAELEFMPQVRTQLGSIRLGQLGLEMEALSARLDAGTTSDTHAPQPPLL